MCRLHPTRLERFANDCIEVQLQANCRARDVFLIQPLVPPVQEHLVELLMMINAAKGASAGRVTVVMPHYAYARSDKKDTPRISIGGRLVADLLAAAGAERMLMMTLHSPQVHGFFSIPVDHLHALRELAEHFQRYDLSNAVVVSPDLGNAKSASAFARILDVPVAAGAKQRFSDDRVVISSIIGDVADRDVIVLDDEIAKGSTVLELLGRLREAGVKSIRVACTHGLFSDGALHRLNEQPDIAGDRVHQHGADPERQMGAEARGALDRAADRRGDPPDPQWRVSQRAVPLSRPGGLGRTDTPDAVYTQGRNRARWRVPKEASHGHRRRNELRRPRTVRCPRRQPDHPDAAEPQRRRVRRPARAQHVRCATRR